MTAAPLNQQEQQIRWRPFITPFLVEAAASPKEDAESDLQHHPQDSYRKSAAETTSNTIISTLLEKYIQPNADAFLRGIVKRRVVKRRGVKRRGVKRRGVKFSPFVR